MDDAILKEFLNHKLIRVKIIFLFLSHEFFFFWRDKVHDSGGHIITFLIPNGIRFEVHLEACKYTLCVIVNFNKFFCVRVIHFRSISI